jgi:hypothetical protein
MTPADDVLQRIDDTLEDWHGSPDAMRWSADAEPGLSGDGGDPDRGVEVSANQVAYVDGDGQWHDLTDAIEGPVRVTYGIQRDWSASDRLQVTLTAYTDAFDRAVAKAVASINKFAAAICQIESDTGKSLTFWALRTARPMAAAERTNSPRRAAGSRRTKRNARRGGRRG